MKQFLFMDINQAETDSQKVIGYAQIALYCIDTSTVDVPLPFCRTGPRIPRQPTVLDLGFVNQTICERAAVQSDRHKNPKGHDARHHSGAPLAFEICEGSPVFRKA
jgi:hypothetical protein